MSKPSLAWPGKWRVSGLAAYAILARCAPMESGEEGTNGDIQMRRLL